MPLPNDPLEHFTTTFPKQLSNIASQVSMINHQLRKFERSSPASQEKLLSAQLSHLLSHAKKCSPFWAQRLASWSPKLGPCREILSGIPPLTRSQLQRDAERIAADFPLKKALLPQWLSSSGSTGVPVRVQQLQKLHAPLYLATTLLMTPWYNFDPSKPMGTVGSKHKDRDGVRLGPPFRWFGHTAVGFLLSNKEHQTQELYDLCASRNPTYLQMGPSIAFELARYAIKSGNRRLRPQLILTLGSAVTEEMRETVLEGLGAKMIDRYSCEETGYIALQCPRHNHLHVISPTTLVEIVDDEGRECSPGKPGRVLLTGMQSYGMPLIRYDIGDLAEWGGGCDCGITLPVIRKVWGRTRHMLSNPDGTRSYVTLYARDFDDVPGLEEYRFVLHRNATIIAQLRVKLPSAQVNTLVTERIQRAVGYPYPVEIRYVDEIDYGMSWKKESFAVSDQPPS